MSSVLPVMSGLPFGRVVASGLRLHLGDEKWMLNGVAYGPFKPNVRGESYPDDQQLARDFADIKSLGFNAVRVYDLPSDAVLREARRQDLRLIAGIPWTDHTDFLSDHEAWHEVRRRVHEVASKFGNGDRVAVLLVGNEIEKTLVRWMKPPKVKAALEQLVAIAKKAAPDCIIAYATYPSTEYIVPDNADIVTVNVYLEEQAKFEKYLRRLMNQTASRPLVISEFGLDAHVHGEEIQAEAWAWMKQTCDACGVAGTVWFSYTDEWFRGGEQVRGWKFGLVDEDRKPRIICQRTQIVPGLSNHGPYFSVVVCTRNGSATLEACLAALEKQTYEKYEVIVVDDGSTDNVPAIAAAHHSVRYLRQDHSGLSVARNTGKDAARGDVVVYTDDDCVPDHDWLRFLASAFDDPSWVAAGGPNLPPPPRNNTERCVAAAPGGPCHVLLNDEEAEHLPGCNLAIRKSALDAIGGFDSVFRAAGDDVDVCWRLREAGGRLRFVPGAMVWHHRRFTLSAYLKQQRGYGHAEALLMKKHPNRFGMMGGARWRGLIYGDGGGALVPDEGAVFHGPYGTGAFQVIYAGSARFGWWHWFAGVLWIALALMFLCFGWLWVAGGFFGCALMFAGSAARKQWRGSGLRYASDALLLWLMCLLQPVIREWARVAGMLKTGARPTFKTALPDIIPPIKPRKFSIKLAERSYWSATGKGREEWMQALRDYFSANKMSWREDDGWRWFDMEQSPLTWHTVTENHSDPQNLTRIRLLLRLDWRWIAAAVTVLLLSQGHLGLIAGLLAVFGAWLAFSAVRGVKLVQRAAEKAGLQAM